MDYDVNKDGKFNILDITKMIEFIKLFDFDNDGTVRLIDLREWLDSLDFDNDNKLSIFDVQTMLEKLYGE